MSFFGGVESGSAILCVTFAAKKAKMCRISDTAVLAYTTVLHIRLTTYPHYTLSIYNDTENGGKVSLDFVILASVSQR